MKVICVIPARLKSRRFPEKVLTMLGPKPLLQHVFEAAQKCPQFDEILFAVDHEKTKKLIHSFQAQALMTKSDCVSGTDRLIELMMSKQAFGTIWVNWQADEPFINRQMIDDLLQSISSSQSDIWTLKKKITKQEEIENPNQVKVVTNLEGKALYFSRSPIPYPRLHHFHYYKHIGLYAFTKRALEKIQMLPPSTPLEKLEQLEQLRFLEGGLTIEVHETLHETVGIDVPEDLIKALKKMYRAPKGY